MNLPLSGIDIYWIGGSGKWSDLSHWATTSGGSIRPSAIPGSKDKVILTPIHLMHQINSFR